MQGSVQGNGVKLQSKCCIDMHLAACRQVIVLWVV